ncbi:MAG TPA: RagB/SusD family nutrient uptake outer membrane protein [Draconibacterium sp.]|nr:RagB/SusD family nutrient uptake outer membrane protein [Draconibacterium sp.]
MNIKKIFLLSLIVLFTISACDSELEVSDPNSMTTADYWQNEEHMGEAVIGIYNAFLTSEYYGRMLQSFTDSRSDDTFGDSGWELYPKVSNFTILPDEGFMANFWSNLYQMIFRANQVLDRIDEIEFSDSNYKGRLKGQALFLRAFTYYHLQNLYGKIPLILETPKSAEEYYPSQATPEAIWQQLETDLATCESLLPQSYANVSGPDAGQIGRATWGSAAGLLAKVLVQQGKNGEAKTQLKKIIDSDMYDLVDNYFDNFTFENENNEESLFEIQFGIFGTAENWAGAPRADWRQATGVNYNYGISNFTAWEDFEATQWFYEQFYEERTVNGRIDPRCYFSVVYNEPEYDTELYDDDPWGRRNKVFGVNPWTDIPNFDGSKYYIAKWTYARIPGYTQESGGVRLNSEINQRVIRYADILLLYAEMINETEGGPTADTYKYINMVRNRVNLPDLPAGMSQQEMREQIYHERLLELGIEGVRWYDMLRWGWLEDPSMVAELKVRDPHDFPTFTPGKELLPIPNTERDVNPNLEPNSNN